MVVEDCAGVGGRGVLSEAGGKKCSLKTKLQWWRIGMWKVVGGLAWARRGFVFVVVTHGEGFFEG